jgi:hypothetical protein
MILGEHPVHPRDAVAPHLFERVERADVQRLLDELGC